MHKTTLKKLREKGACEDRYDHLVGNLGSIGDDDPITLLQVLDSNGIEDTIWAFRAVEYTDDLKLYICDVAEHVLLIFEKEFPGDDCPKVVVETTRKYIKGKVSSADLEKAAYAATSATSAATYAADAAAYATYAAYAAYAAVYAARAAARAAAYADAAYAATYARAAEREWQAKRLREVITIGQERRYKDALEKRKADVERYLGLLLVMVPRTLNGVMYGDQDEWDLAVVRKLKLARADVEKLTGICQAYGV